MTAPSSLALRVALASVAFFLGSPAKGLDDKAEFDALLAVHAARGDYRERRYDQGVDRLEKAARDCGKVRCSPSSKAAVLRELGAMEFKRGNEEAAAKFFRQARRLAPDLPFTHEKEADLVAAWNEAATRDEGESAPPPDPPESAPSDPPDAEPAEGAARTREWARFWFGVTGTLEFLFLPAATDLCKLSPTGHSSNDVGAYCTNPDGSDFPSRRGPGENDGLAPGASGSLPGGMTIGNARVLLTFDYAPLPNVLVGARLGYAFNTYPGSAAPGGFPWLDRNLHAELRATYLFGSHALSEIGFAPLVYLASGAAEFDGHLRSAASLRGVAGQRPVRIWIVRGPWFLSLGTGARYQFSLRTALTAALRINTVLGEPSTMLTIGPEIGVAYGF